jgi:uncharacterized repeat protein (TIGR01451 family)
MVIRRIIFVFMAVCLPLVLVAAVFFATTSIAMAITERDDSNAVQQYQPGNQADLGVGASVANSSDAMVMQASQRVQPTPDRQTLPPDGERYPSTTTPLSIANIADSSSFAGNSSNRILTAKQVGPEAGFTVLNPLAPPLASSANLEICLDSGRVWGSVSSGDVITVAVNGTQRGAASADHIGFFWTTLYNSSGSQVNLATGNQMRIYRNGVSEANVTLRSISGQIDALTDQVSGVIGGTSSPIAVTVYADTTEPTMTAYSQTVTTDSSGNFTVDFTDVWDFFADGSAVVGYTVNGVEVHRVVHAHNLILLPIFGNMQGWATPGVTVTAMVYSATNTIRWQGAMRADKDGFYQFQPDMRNGDVAVAMVNGGGVYTRTIAPLDVSSINVLTNEVIGVTDPNVVVSGISSLLGADGWHTIQITTTSDPSGNFTLDFDGDAEILPNRWVGVYVADAEGDEVCLWLPPATVEVNQTSDEVYGWAGPQPGPSMMNVPINITVYHPATDSTWTGGKHTDWFGQYNFTRWGDNLPDLQPGDVVTVEANSWQEVVTVEAITVQANPATNQFNGTITPPTSRVEVWGNYNYDNLFPIGGSFATLANGSSGSFSATPVGFDVNNYQNYNIGERQANEHLDLINRTTDGFNVYVENIAQGIWGTLNPEGAAYTVTVRDSSNNLKMQGFNATENNGGFWYGFQSPGLPLAAGDTVRIQSASGFNQVLVVPNMAVSANLNTGVITLIAPANQLVYVEVSRPNTGATIAQGFIPTDSDGQVTVLENQLQSYEEPFQPGDWVSLCYRDANGNAIWHAFHFPAPSLAVNKWADNQPAEGGNYAYHIEYRNDGDAPAENTTITDTLAGVSYLSDTSGFSHSGSGTGPIVWHMGTVAAGSKVIFDIFVSVDALQGEWITNTVQIATSNPYDQNNQKQSSHNTQVQANQTQMNVSKGAWTGDPAAGGTIVYEINVCNNGPTASGPVYVTDTLPTLTPFQSWWSQTPGWVQTTASSGQLVLVRPSIFGWNCEQIYLKALVDANAAVNTEFQNLVHIYSSSDTTSGDDDSTWYGRVGWPRTNLNINKNWGHGQLTPGGIANYWVNYRNDGNLPVGTFRITETLPVSTTFVGAIQEDRWGNQTPFNPILVTDSYVVWQINGMENGYSDQFRVALLINPLAIPGTILTNTVVISPQPFEERSSDNTSQAIETVSPHGPNVRTGKYHQWRNNGTQLYYDGWLDNVGDQQATMVVLTDTYPALTSFQAGSLGWDGWYAPIAYHDNGSQLVVYFPPLDPGNRAPIRFTLDVAPSAVGQPFLWFTNTIEIATASVDVNLSNNTYRDGAYSGNEVIRFELRVGQQQNDAWGRAVSGPITITTATGQYTTNTNPSCDGCDNWRINDVGAVNPGDIVTITAGSGLQPIIVQVSEPFTTMASSITNRVWGHVEGAGNALIEVNPDNLSAREVRADANGNFNAAFPDLPRGVRGEVRYRYQNHTTEIALHLNFASPDLIINTNYAQDWVEFNYEAGHTTWITVTDSSGAIKATHTGLTGPISWWNWQNGYSTNQGAWVPRQPDILPGDVVYASLSNGYTTSVRVGTISGNLDVVRDMITVTVAAPWFSQMLNASCNVQNSGGAWVNFKVSPLAGEYTCDFSALWDVIPGQNLWVQYQEPDGDWVINVFRAPTPQLYIDKWYDGNPGQDGNFTYHIHYWNNGDGWAENVQITDTLSAGMVYLSDTLTFTKTTSPNQVVWNVGDLAPNTGGQFVIYVHVTAAAGAYITNTAQISTSNPYNQPDQLLDSASAQVLSNQAQLNVGKGAWTWDPAPGTDFIYNINTCNNGGTGSAELTLTDTLPLSTTLLSWWGRESGWSEVVRSAHQLVLSHPTIPGNQCYEVYARVHLDATSWAGMQLHNTAVFTASNDLVADDNTTEIWHNVNWPYYNLHIEKQWNWGQLTPSGLIRYNINYRNDGNLPIAHAIRITDTLPVGTSFVASYTYDQYGQHPFTPLTIGDGYVVWQLSSLDNGYGYSIEVVLQVNSQTAAGTELVNCASISANVFEDNPYDNQSCTTESISSIGPNLRVTKFGNWQGGPFGPASNINYNIRFENIGTTTVNNVVLTDTYPAGTTLNRWNFNWNNGPWSWAHNAGNRQLVLTLDRLEPGWVSWLNMNVAVTGAPVSNGLFYTNTVMLSTPPGDTNPADNTDVLVLGTGPDLSIEKSITGGNAEPGQLLTYTLHIQNNTDWWTTGNVLITDTLPAGLQFVSAQQRRCGSTFFCQRTPDVIAGQSLQWNWGQMKSWEWNDLIVTVRVTSSAQGGQVFTNMAEIASSDPANDQEPGLVNNQDSVSITVLNPIFGVSKVYAGNRVAGTVVTYTLSVANTGNEAGTHVVLTDTLPANTTYLGSDGSRTGSTVQWVFNQINAGATATGKLYGTLACTAGLTVNNAHYQVTGSDQGVNSAEGAPVSFNIISPTISVNFSFTSGVLVAGQTINFNASVTTNGTPMASYTWNFGDSTTGSGASPSHSYSRDGVYSVALILTDGCGYQKVITRNVTISAPTITANFTQNATNVLVTSSVRFTDTSTTNGSVITAWLWNFGDGSAPVMTKNATHAYLQVGTYTVSLIVTDTLGYSAKVTKTNLITVVSGCVPLTGVSITHSPAQPETQASVTFTATIAPANATGPISYAWNFGDGTTLTSSLAVVQHTYLSAGNYSVTVTATSSCSPTGVSSPTVIVSVKRVTRVFLPLIVR